MSTVIWHVTMSVDGFIAGPNDSMDWVVAQWSDGGASTRDIDVQRSALAEEVLQAAGAILGGRRWYDVAVRKFDGYDGIYGGQWSEPVFVLTHRAPDTSSHPAITFLSGSIGEAVATAKDAAAGKAVIVFGANLRRSAFVRDCSMRSSSTWSRSCLGTGSGSSMRPASARSCSSVSSSGPQVRSPTFGLQFVATARKATHESRRCS
jgi:dihydrofolate reductase